MSMKAKKAKADKLYQEFHSLRANGHAEQSLKIEREYAQARIELIDEVTKEVAQRKSMTMDKLEALVDSLPKKVKIHTGIYPLDLHLVNENQGEEQEIGGFSLGNFIQIAGAKYAGKTTLMMKIMTNLSKTEKVSWFDFEMGREKAVSTSRLFHRKTQNLNYYDGGRDIKEVVDEIKFLYAEGVKHFVIDSMMKLTTKEYKRGYESTSYISNLLSELTSSMGINIYMINQMSQDSLRNGDLFMKHGNDIEYDSDYIFFVMRKTTGKKDNYGLPIYDENCRVLVCTKNRVDHNTFAIEIEKKYITYNNKE